MMEGRYACQIDAGWAHLGVRAVAIMSWQAIACFVRYEVL